MREIDMKIIDAQQHDPAPRLDWSGYDRQTQYDILNELALAYLDALGVSGVVLFTPEEWGAAAARASPERLAFVPRITPDVDDIEASVARAKENRENGQLAVRAVIGWPPDGEVQRFEDGKWEPVFKACEKYHVPVFMFISGWLPLAAGVAERFPDLTLIIDHLGLQQPPMEVPEEPPFRSLPDLLALAKFPNVAVKMCGLPALSDESYPYRDVVPYMREIVDAFGADRLMWASDITRFNRRSGLQRSETSGTQEPYKGKHTYAQSLNFVLDCPELSDDEKASILGGTVSRLLGWP
jgi:L-fuconolactonase